MLKLTPPYVLSTPPRYPLDTVYLHREHETF